MPSEGKPVRKSTPEENFARNIRIARESKGMSQADLVGMLEKEGVSLHRQTLQKIETGSRPLRLQEARAITDALGAEFEVMFSDPRQIEMENEQFELESIRDDLVSLLADFYQKQNILAFKLDASGSALNPIGINILEENHETLHRAAIKQARGMIILEALMLPEGSVRHATEFDADGNRRTDENRTHYQRMVQAANPALYAPAEDNEES